MRSTGQLNSWTQRRADAALALVAVAWGSSYLLMKIGLEGMGPFTVIALRFLLAFGIMGVVSFKKMRRTDTALLARAAVLGLFLFGLFAFLMHGLQSTSASNGGFLTAMSVVFVPLLNAAMKRRAPARSTLIGTGITVCGIALLSLQGSLSLHPGDALCLLGSFVYALFIILTDRLSPSQDGFLLGVWQLGFAGLYGLVCALVFETPHLPASPSQWGAVLGLALVCSAFGFVTQSMAQPHTTPEHTALLFALEPVASAILAFLALGETLSAQGYVGAVLVVAGVLAASLLNRVPAADKKAPELSRAAVRS